MTVLAPISTSYEDYQFGAFKETQLDALCWMARVVKSTLVFVGVNRGEEVNVFMNTFPIPWSVSGDQLLSDNDPDEIKSILVDKLQNSLNVTVIEVGRKRVLTEVELLANLFQQSEPSEDSSFLSSFTVECTQTRETLLGKLDVLFEDVKGAIEYLEQNHNISDEEHKTIEPRQKRFFLKEKCVIA